MANQTGKRYACASCGSEMLVTRGGEGALSCCNLPMQPRGTGAASGAAGGTASGVPTPTQAQSEVQRG